MTGLAMRQVRMMIVGWDFLSATSFWSTRMPASVLTGQESIEYQQKLDAEQRECAGQQAGQPMAGVMP